MNIHGGQSQRRKKNATGRVVCWSVATLALSRQTIPSTMRVTVAPCVAVFLTAALLAVLAVPTAAGTSCKSSTNIRGTVASRFEYSLGQQASASPPALPLPSRT